VGRTDGHGRGIRRNCYRSLVRQTVGEKPLRGRRARSNSSFEASRFCVRRLRNIAPAVFDGRFRSAGIMGKSEPLEPAHCLQ
jgi:hypothetical protein